MVVLLMEVITHYLFYHFAHMPACPAMQCYATAFYVFFSI